MSTSSPTVPLVQHMILPVPRPTYPSTVGHPSDPHPHTPVYPPRAIYHPNPNPEFQIQITRPRLDTLSTSNKPYEYIERSNYISDDNQSVLPADPKRFLLSPAHINPASSPIYPPPIVRHSSNPEYGENVYPITQAHRRVGGAFPSTFVPPLPQASSTRQDLGPSGLQDGYGSVKQFQIFRGENENHQPDLWRGERAVVSGLGSGARGVAKRLNHIW